MTDAAPQLQLFESFAPSVIACSQISRQPREASTSSSALRTSTTIAATATIPTAHAQASTTRAAAANADGSPDSVSSTAASAAQATLPMNTGPVFTPDQMLSVPRPRTRADCNQEARPCPWGGCRHHLLLEVATARQTRRRTQSGQLRDERATSLRLNRRSSSGGRRPGLASSAAYLVVRRWIDDATEQLSNMRYTCSLDVARDYPDGLTEKSVGLLLGVTHQAIHSEERIALIKFRAGMRKLRLKGEDL